MALNLDQEKGLKTIVERYNGNKPYTVLSGYAGTGKSYLLRHAISALGLNPETDVAFATPTGKAAQVLTNMGNKNAQTIHRLLYEWYPTPQGGFRRKRIPFLPYNLVICDEVSMIDAEMIKDLLSHTECHVIFTGDPFQLEPINRGSENLLLHNPHVFLNQIMRQALESDIVRLSMEVREGKSIEPFKGTDAQVISKSDMVNGMFTWADQIICAKNDTRMAFNREVNALKGFDLNGVYDGQKVICLRNYWNIVSEEGEPLVNGTIGYLDNVRMIRRKIAPSLGGGYVETALCNLITENQDIYYDLPLDKQQLITGQRTITDPKLLYRIDKFYNSPWAIDKGLVNPIPLEAEMGWAITCHKAQGSTFGKVLVQEEAFPFNQQEHQRWIYTAMTRPSDKLVFVQK